MSVDAAKRKLEATDPKDRVYEGVGNRAHLLRLEGSADPKSEGDTFWRSFTRKFQRLTMNSRLGISEKRRETVAGMRFKATEEFFRAQADESLKFFSENDRKSFSEKAADYYLAEMSCLRGEIVDIKNRELNSERLAASAAFLIAGLYISGQLSGSNLVAQVFIFFAPFFFIVFGYIRAKEYQRNIFEIDCYLREIEFWFTQAGGWVNYFFRFRAMERYFHTRLWVWLGIGVFYVVGWALGLALNTDILEIAGAQDAG